LRTISYRMPSSFTSHKNNSYKYQVLINWHLPCFVPLIGGIPPCLIPKVNSMIPHFPALWAVGVSLSRALEQTRDPWLVTSAALLILLALTYLASARARYAIELRLAARTPTMMKRWLGCLLLILPGVLILATVYYPGKTKAVEQQPDQRTELIYRRQREELATLIKSSKNSPQVSRRAEPPRSGTRREWVAGHSDQPRVGKGSDESDSRASASARRLAAGHEQVARETAPAKLEARNKTTAESDPEVWLTKGGHIAAVTTGELDAAVRHLKDKDLESFQRLEASQRAVVLKEGLTVTITDYDYVSGKVRVHLKGSKVRFWTFKEALKKE